MWRHKVNWATPADIMPRFRQGLHAKTYIDASVLTGSSEPTAQMRVFDPAHPVGRTAGLAQAGAACALWLGAGEQLGEFWVVGGGEQRQAVQHAADHRAP